MREARKEKPRKISRGFSFSKYTDVALEMLRESFDSNVDERAEKSNDGNNNI
jgi:hypothetical protein